ncbi:MAG: RecQ family ATP-dependent DNA helicase [Verrucomicrobiales bacterium]|nr:RecQ family ATP-dependent DNA helicase [Verrucomicrobiales bacterium]
MRETAARGDAVSNDPTEEFLRRALIVDLEVSRSGRIAEIGAVLGDETLTGRGDGATAGWLAQLGRMTARASVVVGHNIRRHDLPLLRASVPDHPILALPVVDTLELSPLAFPKNPYHRLVKDYKLVRESVNDPVADARQSGILLTDEIHAFAVLRRSDPALFQLLRDLLVAPDATAPFPASGYKELLDGLESPVAGGPDFAPREFPGDRVELATLATRVRSWVGERGCVAAPVDASWLQTSEQHLALAYVLAWLSVAGTDSVLPAWVRRTFPDTTKLIRNWREIPCDSAACPYCRRTHDPREQLRRYFRFEDFRSRPVAVGGGSLQREIVAAGMRDESMLAVLPTGGGKSLCFQLPAIARNFRRGALTIVLSPLQALMKDQVDGLVRRTGAPFAAALYGMQTPVERGAVLRRVAAGDTAILYVAPEQLRNRSFESAIALREVGCWVFDEAHCLSKWGHDFRPDYLYAARFIREFALRQGGEVPPIACFTATAKREVREEILAHFKSETGRELRLFEGGVDRDNLEFEVQSIHRYAKMQRLSELLNDELGPGTSGSAVVFRARRDETVATAEFLVRNGWKAAHFHAGLTPSEKKRIQDEFLAGQIQVICATNAFGMGIDKDDVRLVIHLDTPGSLENYLQEAGRAGRDGRRATCVLLYDEADCEDQFRLGARSELSRRDLSEILRGIRRAGRDGREEIVVTTGEILRDEELETDLALRDRSADTQVRTAVAWLERAGFLQRNENSTSVFQARLLVRNLEEANRIMSPLGLSEFQSRLWLAILRELMTRAPNEPLTVDRLALLPEFEVLSCVDSAARASPEKVSARILKILRSMDQVGLLKRDTRLNAYVRHKVADHSRQRFDAVVRAERRMIGLMAEADPEPEGWVPLSLRPLNQRLIDGGCETSMELLRALLRSLSEDGRGFAGGQGSLDLRFVAMDAYRVRVGRNWREIEALAARRHRVAEVVLKVLLAKIPSEQGPKAELLVEFGFEELQKALESDLELRSEVREVESDLERALMYLHELRVIVLQQGLAVFRSAMTLRLTPDRRQDRYRNSDFEPLRHHYRERMLQIHVMAEYARRGLQQIQQAHAFVLSYFAMGKEEFIRRFFGSKPDVLEHATTARSFQSIVTDLGNPAQIRIVTAPVHRNLLVLAGPGSGKTRTVVHRCAYLLRVERVPPRGILVCCFNRHAAHELRRRLFELVGDDARGVLVQTYHGLALRLLGRSLESARSDVGDVPDFDAMVRDAAALLRGESKVPGLEPDEVRDRLLAGFRHILVDEYQDIDEPQYAMISAIAGRGLSDSDQCLSIMAVGDDDQNIYAFRGANVRFIRQFQQDYAADVHHLVENYRSTRYLIEAANQAIAPNTDRMKAEHPIRIDAARALHPPGGEFGQRDSQTHGRLQIRSVLGQAEQAAAALAEIRRLGVLGVSDFSRMAVLGETHRDLAAVRALLEREAIPVRWLACRGSIPLEQVREVRDVLNWLGTDCPRETNATQVSAAIDALFARRPANPWIEFVRRQVENWKLETGDVSQPAAAIREFLREACEDGRRGGGWGAGVALGTVHAAKGTEHDHVMLIGAWALPAARQRREELRRAFYVGITRARHSLTLIHQKVGGEGCAELLEGPAVLRHPMASPVSTMSTTEVSYEEVDLRDLDLGFAGRQRATHPIHAALARLTTGSRVQLVKTPGGSWVLKDASNAVVGRLSRLGASRWADHAEGIREIRVLAMLRRSVAMDHDQQRRESCQVAEWEVPIIEIVTETGPAGPKVPRGGGDRVH